MNNFSNSENQEEISSEKSFFDSIQTYDLNLFAKNLENFNTKIFDFINSKNMNGK